MRIGHVHGEPSFRGRIREFCPFERRMLTAHCASIKGASGRRTIVHGDSLHSLSSNMKRTREGTGRGGSDLPCKMPLHFSNRRGGDNLVNCWLRSCFTNVNLLARRFSGRVRRHAPGLLPRFLDFPDISVSRAFLLVRYRMRLVVQS
jgi:hypothetical protein